MCAQPASTARPIIGFSDRCPAARHGFEHNPALIGLPVIRPYSPPPLIRGDSSKGAVA